MRLHRKRNLNIITYLILSIGAIAVLFPFLRLVLASLQSLAEISKQTWLPSPPKWKNYSEALTLLNFGRYFLNSCLYSGSATLGGLLTVSLAAFSFARLRFPGRNLIFGICIATMMIPASVVMIPRFLLFSKLGWINTYYPLIIPWVLGTSGFYIFLMRQFFMTIPKEIDDAAKIDGCGSFRLYWHIFLPIAKPGLLVVGIYIFMATWSDLLGPIIYLNSENLYTASQGLSLLGQAASVSTTTEEPFVHFHHMLATSVVYLLPPLFIFFIIQKYFLKGVAFGSLK